ncbi:caudovirales tail fiber assembly family protein [Escherichia coli 2741950]|nr:caudovirales tail fiber assembly family protein [Escherichia coli 2741950]ENA88534.1 caudovirales tail fiber assembly family protein [Escherichia coli 2741950]
MKEEYLTNGSLPSDVIEVSDSVRNEYNFAPPEGKQLSSSQNMPVWIDIPPATREELIAAAEQERQKLLAHADAVMLDWRTELMLGEISDANRAKLSAWLAYKNGVKSADVTTDPEHVNWPVPPEA